MASGEKRFKAPLNYDMHVFLTGASGFVGTYILQHLIRRGHRTTCLLRPDGSLPIHRTSERIAVVEGDVLRAESLQGKMEGCDAVIHLVGIIKEKPTRGITFRNVHYGGTRHIADEARATGISRFVLMSANGARPDGVSAYQNSKWEAEQYVQQAGFEHWTIFRPSTLFGEPQPDQPEFTLQLARTLIKPFPVIPILGDGQYRMQPIFVGAVADAFVQSLERAEAQGQTYVAVGKQSYSFIQIVDIITQALGMKPKPKIRQPLWLVRPVVRLFSPLGILPITRDQLEMLVEGNTGENGAFYEDFDVEAQPFISKNLYYLKKYV